MTNCKDKKEKMETAKPSFCLEFQFRENTKFLLSFAVVK